MQSSLSDFLTYLFTLDAVSFTGKAVNGSGTGGLAELAQDNATHPLTDSHSAVAAPFPVSPAGTGLGSCNSHRDGRGLDRPTDKKGRRAPCLQQG